MGTKIVLAAGPVVGTMGTMESATETLPDPDEPPTQVASPACPNCRAVYTMRDLVFGHPCDAKEMN